MSKIAVVISELAHYAPGEIAAISPQDLIKQSKVLQSHKWSEREVSTALSQAALGNSSWHKWVKQIKVTGKKRAYYYLPNSTQPQLTPTGKLAKVSKRTRKAPCAIPAPSSASEYKLEISGPEVLISTKLSRAEVTLIMNAIFGGERK